jgi:hypothetical protein
LLLIQSLSPIPRVLKASLPSVENRTLEQKGNRSYTEPFDDHFVERALKTEKFIPAGLSLTIRQLVRGLAIHTKAELVTILSKRVV